MQTLTMTNAAAKVLAAILNQPEAFTKTAEILRAGDLARQIEDTVPDEPMLTKQNPHGEEVAAFRRLRKEWEREPFSVQVSEKTLACAKAAVTKLVEKGKLGADGTVVCMLRALGFTDGDE